jgi:uncharacterized protein
LTVSRRSFLKSASVSLALAYARPWLLSEQTPAPLDEFGYGDVRLAPGLAQTQFEQTQALLLQMNVDSLLKPWRLRAGLPAPGPLMGGWYDEVPLDKTPSGGHGFAPAHSFGQWISALSRGYAVTGDQARRAKVEQILAGYEPAISGRFYTNCRFPAYNYDKCVCGLIDAHSFCGLDSDYKLLNLTTEAAEPHLPPRALDRGEPQRKWRRSIGEPGGVDYDESYTLPENLFLAWRRGAGDHYRVLASRFLSDDTFFDPLAAGKNVLAGHHAYSYCNALSSAIQAYFCNQSEKHLAAARNAFQMMEETQSFATGGWGPNEEFVAPGSGALFTSLTKTHRGFETPCGSYAHFKLTRYLLRITRDGRYGDSMERVLYNTVLGAKRLEADGHAFYYSDYNNHGSKTYFPDRWPCCSGTLPQVAADYHLMIYFRDPRGLYVNLYLPSELKWTADNGAQLTLTQSGDYPNDGHIQLGLRASRSARFTMRLRIPGWAKAGAQSPAMRVNGTPVDVSIDGGFAAIDRTWEEGDQVELTLPMTVRLEPIDGEHADTVALVRGPLVLFALGENLPISRSQALSVQREAGGTWRVAGQRFAPFVAIDEEAYMTYFKLRAEHRT